MGFTGVYNIESKYFVDNMVAIYARPKRKRAVSATRLRLFSKFKSHPQDMQFMDISSIVECVRQIAFSDATHSSVGWRHSDVVTKSIASQLLQFGLTQPHDYFFMDYHTCEGTYQSIFLKNEKNNVYKRVTKLNCPLLQRSVSFCAYNGECSGKRGNKLPMRITFKDVEKCFVGDSYHPDSVEIFRPFTPVQKKTHNLQLIENRDARVQS